MKVVNDYRLVPEAWLLGDEGDIDDWSLGHCNVKGEFDPKKARLFLDYMQTGMTERQACLEVPIEERLVRSWKRGMRGAPDSFIRAYERAREQQIHAMADDIVDISDGTDVRAAETIKQAIKDTKNPFRKGIANTVEKAVSELASKTGNRIATRKWYVSKILPKYYGDRMQLDHSSPADKPVKVNVSELTTEQLEKLAALDAELKAVK